MVDNSIFRLEVEEIREPNDHNMSLKKKSQFVLSEKISFVT